MNLHDPSASLPDDQLAIRVRDVGKCYRVFERPQDRLLQAFWRGRRQYYREFWALRGATFDAPRGTTVGIIGRNGCGKSTLLQMISGTLTPTTGQIDVRGRLAALLELGSGFNPDFTGRENIYLNAALLGLSRREIDERFDEIVAFSKLADFIDRPVKTYSSGMFVRLAFSIATSVEPEILVVDEALAVGDEAFQRQCFARIREIQQRGGTILFVSHASATIVELCDVVHLFDGGILLFSGHPKLAVSQYHRLLYAPPERAEEIRREILELHRHPEKAMLTKAPPRPQAIPVQPPATYVDAAPAVETIFDPHLQPTSTLHYEQRGGEILNPRITTVDGEPANLLTPRESYTVRYQVRISEPVERVRFATLVKNTHGTELGGALTSEEEYEQLHPGQIVDVAFTFRCLLTPGTYFLNVGVSGLYQGEPSFIDRIVDCLMFRVLAPTPRHAYGPLDLMFESEIDIEYAGDQQEEPLRHVA